MPFFHGHAINIDMALSTTLAEQRGHLSVADRDRVLGVMSDLGLALDSEHLTPELLAAATASILKTRDGLLRAAIPAPIGQCRFLNDVTIDELADTLTLHKKICLDYPRGGDGIDMFTVDDTGGSHEYVLWPSMTAALPGHGPSRRRPSSPRSWVRCAGELADGGASTAALLDRLRRARDLAAGLDPYLDECTTPESPALAALGASDTRDRLGRPARRAPGSSRRCCPGTSRVSC